MDRLYYYYYGHILNFITFFKENYFLYRFIMREVVNRQITKLTLSLKLLLLVPLKFLKGEMPLWQAFWLLLPICYILEYLFFNFIYTQAECSQVLVINIMLRIYASLCLWSCAPNTRKWKSIMFHTRSMIILFSLLAIIDHRLLWF